MASITVLRLNTAVMRMRVASGCASRTWARNSRPDTIGICWSVIDRELLLLQDAQGVDGVRRGDDAVTLAQQSVAQGHQHNLFVVHDQDRTRRLARIVWVQRHSAAQLF